jgi:hypothetical protein
MPSAIAREPSICFNMAESQAAAAAPAMASWAAVAAATLASPSLPENACRMAMITEMEMDDAG